MSFPLRQAINEINDANAVAGDEENSSSPAPRLYRVIWRWHFYAGLFVWPVLVVVAMTGALYVFRPELEQRFNAAMMTVEPQSQRVSYETQLANAKAIAPAEARATAMLLRADPTWPTQFAFSTKDGNNLNIFVNQHTGVVQGSYVYGNSFFDFVMTIHRRLAGGMIGRIAVELATSWGIILAITGLYLWWPRGRDKVLGVWLPRFRAKNYLVWRDWHAVPGFYAAVFAILLMFTGLFYTMGFGRGYQRMLDVTNSNPTSFAETAKSVRQPGAVPLPLDEIIAIAGRTQTEKELYIDLPNNAEASVYVYAGSSDRPHTLTQFYIDQYSGRVMGLAGWAQLPLLYKIQLLAYPIHAGTILGWPTRVLALLTCLLLAAMGVTGVAMWWIRRPKGKAGFPQKSKDVQLSKWLIVLIGLLGVLMPAAGISMIVILVGDWMGRLFRRRFQAG
ncbi:MAG: PepSY domain-containing protein [Acidobacteriota bacterium]|nr:PepSY domain-containing protein [Acidobacteriota bacterium]